MPALPLIKHLLSQLSRLPQLDLLHSSSKLIEKGALLLAGCVGAALSHLTLLPALLALLLLPGKLRRQECWSHALRAALNCTASQLHCKAA